jgi:hypothetical protein
VVSYKVPVRQAISVEENNIVAINLLEAFIEDPAFPETLIFVPNVLER